MNKHAEEAERELARADGDVPRWIESAEDAHHWKTERLAVAQVQATLAVAEELEGIWRELTNSGAMA